MTDQPLKRGTKVLIKKGTVLHSTNPSKRNFIAGRDYVVTIYDSNPSWEYEGNKHIAEVVWAGTHGYWTYAPLDAVIVWSDNLTFVEQLANHKGLLK